MTKPKPKAGKAPLTEEELTRVIEASAYPTEIALFNLFAEAEMAPIHGHRVRIGEETRELDLIAHETVRFDAHDFAEFKLVALVEAKKLQPPACMVGFLGERPSDLELRLARARMAGVPTFNVLEDGGAVPGFMSAEDGIFQAFDPLNDVPVCIQWGQVQSSSRRSLKLEALRLEHEPSTWQDITKAVDLAFHLAVETTHGSIAAPDGSVPFPAMRFYCPTLVLDTKTLYTYDPAKRTLAEVPWFILKMNFEIAGRVMSRIVDVVTFDAVSDLIRRYRMVAERLGEVGLRHRSELEALGATDKMRDPRRAQDEFRASLNALAEAIVRGRDRREIP